jgi:hypothetical protein
MFPQLVDLDHHNQMCPAIYTNASLFLCRINRFEDALSLSSSGIKFSKEYNNLS